MTSRALQDEPDNLRSFAGTGLLAPKMTLSWYEKNGTHERGTIEMNATFTDGSVARYVKASWDAGWPGNEADESMSGTPEFGDGANYPSSAGGDGWWQTIPMR